MEMPAGSRGSREPDFAREIFVEALENFRPKGWGLLWEVA
jgi:hypothetical protein